ncbi:MAG: hypothetical protein IPK10_17425 [Bacteroidetes bacterium]|nr:hypothetical protein [Bacteroidota bacterium]
MKGIYFYCKSTILLCNLSKQLMGFSFFITLHDKIRRKLSVFLPKSVKFKSPHILVLVCVLLYSVRADCQRFNTLNYTIQEGLPGNHLNSIYQDRIGRLWIGTMSGACRFDGKTFTRFDQGVFYLIIP